MHVCDSGTFFCKSIFEIDPGGPHKRGPRRTDDRWRKAPTITYLTKAFDFMPEKFECGIDVYGRDFLPHFK